MSPDSLPKDILGVSILLRDNNVDFHIRESELKLLEDTLTKIVFTDPAEPQMVRLDTTIGRVTFRSTALTGWIIYDDPSQVKGWITDEM